MIRELYAEAVIEEATPDGYLRLEYSQSGEAINSCMEAKITSPEISIKVGIPDIDVHCLVPY